MKKKIKLSNFAKYELKNDKINSIVAGEAGMCDYACGCSCACEPNDQFGSTNNANGNASSTESAGTAQAVTEIGVAIIVGGIFYLL